MRNYLSRLVRFTYRNAIQNTRFFLTYALRFFDPEYAIHPLYLDETELIAAIDAGKSLIRLGDGEIYLVNYGTIHYQRYDPRLRAFLVAMIREYSADSAYVIGIPQTYLGMTNTELKKISLFHCWLPFKVTFNLRFSKIAHYFDAHLFYRTNSFVRVLERALAGKKVIVVTNQDNWKLIQNAGIEEKLDVLHVQCPAEDAFSVFDDLLDSIRTAAHNQDGKECRVLISAGPTSKALVYQLSSEGIVSYDLGKGIEAVYMPNTIESLI